MSARKLAAKKFNEHMKLLATSLNAISLTTFGAAFILPSVTGTPAVPPLFWIIVSALLHLSAHAALRLMKSEE